MCAKTGDGAVDGCFCAGTLADLPLGLVVRDLLHRLLSHRFERVAYFVFRWKQCSERRLAKIYGEGSTQGVVEDGVAGRIGEIGQHNSVFFGELGGHARALQSGSANEEQDRKDNADDELRF